MNTLNGIARHLVLFLAGVLLLTGRARAQEEVVDKPMPAPPPMEEVIVPAPGEGAVWIPGHWNRKKEEWVWEKGRWVNHPLPNAYWLPSHWEERNGKWHWKNGAWAFAPEGYVVTRVIEIPDVPDEVRPPKPAGREYWLPGGWEWAAGTWQWRPGRWTNKPRERAEWIAGRWEKSGDQDEWRWISGHWRAPER